ncbi:MAG TPA: DUF327 family protein [Treponemataceae bacterium]|nr:DUF327 family protein [Treponemataceae bacterium]HPS43794.1 DUF327 family protein [Treponemataceae bacterium]
MAGPSPVDSSPFFASIAGHAALAGGALKASDKKEKDKPGVKRFDRLVKEELGSKAADAGQALPAHLAGLPPEKVLSALLDEVHSSGDLLKEKPLPDNIVAYKNAVRSFVRYVVDRAYTVTESTSGGNVLKRKKFTQVQVIDQKLEQLAAGILSNQRPQLGLLEKIEEINGLLVDLLS